MEESEDENEVPFWFWNYAIFISSLEFVIKDCTKMVLSPLFSVSGDSCTLKKNKDT